MTRGAIVIVVGLLLSGVSAYAHHSQAAQYDTSKEVKIQGTLVQFQFRNPHSFVQIDAPDDKGVMQRWGVEWGGAGQLGGQNITRYTLKSGDHVIVTGNPGRNPPAQCARRGHGNGERLWQRRGLGRQLCLRLAQAGNWRHRHSV